jgi:hypothetical protein
VARNPQAKNMNIVRWLLYSFLALGLLGGSYLFLVAKYGESVEIYDCSGTETTELGDSTTEAKGYLRLAYYRWFVFPITSRDGNAHFESGLTYYFPKIEDTTTYIGIYEIDYKDGKPVERRRGCSQSLVAT